MERLLTQTGTWVSIAAPDDPKDPEIRTEHSLSGIRVSVSSRSVSDSGTGERRISASAVLFYKAGFSAVDGESGLPEFRPGDVLISPIGEEWTVRGVVTCFSPDGSIHHLEVHLA